MPYGTSRVPSWSAARSFAFLSLGALAGQCFILLWPTLWRSAAARGPVRRDLSQANTQKPSSPGLRLDSDPTHATPAWRQAVDSSPIRVGRGVQVLAQRGDLL